MRDSTTVGMPARSMNAICSGPAAIIAYSSSPPARRSSLRTSTRKPSGPHQDSMPALVVHNSQTSSIDAPTKVRSMVTRCLFCFGMSVTPLLGCPRLLSALELFSQPVQAFVPEAAVTVHPLLQLAKRLGPQRIQPPRAFGTHAHEAGLAEDAQVPRDTRLIDLDRRNDVVDRTLAVTQRVHDAPARRVGQGLEDVGMHGYAYAPSCIYCQARSRGEARDGLPAAVLPIYAASCRRSALRIRFACRSQALPRPRRRHQKQAPPSRNSAAMPSQPPGAPMSRPRPSTAANSGAQPQAAITVMIEPARTSPMPRK